MQPLVCQKCGAALPVPEDVDAVVARCQFCGDETPLPEDILEARAEQRRALLEAEARQGTAEAARSTRRSASRAVGLVLVLAVAVPLLVTGAVLAVVYVAAPAPTSTSAPAAGGTTAPAGSAAPTTAPHADDPTASGAARTTALLETLYGQGCKDVLMPPETTAGERTLDTRFVLNGRCVRVLAVTGVPANTLTLEMKNPFGEKLATPPPSTEVDFTYCPKTPGPHPTHITPATDDPYTVAAVECPPGGGKKK